MCVCVCVRVCVSHTTLCAHNSCMQAHTQPKDAHHQHMAGPDHPMDDLMDPFAALEDGAPVSADILGIEGSGSSPHSRDQDHDQALQPSACMPCWASPGGRSSTCVSPS